MSPEKTNELHIGATRFLGNVTYIFLNLVTEVPFVMKYILNMYSIKEHVKRHNMDNNQVPTKKLKSSSFEDVLAVTSNIDRSEYQKCILS
jgi:hypothetical protein